MGPAAASAAATVVVLIIGGMVFAWQGWVVCRDWRVDRAARRIRAEREEDAFWSRVRALRSVSEQRAAFADHARLAGRRHRRSLR